MRRTMPGLGSVFTTGDTDSRVVPLLRSDFSATVDAVFGPVIVIPTRRTALACPAYAPAGVSRKNATAILRIICCLPADPLAVFRRGHVLEWDVFASLSLAVAAPPNRSKTEANGPVARTAFAGHDSLGSATMVVTARKWPATCQSEWRRGANPRCGGSSFRCCGGIGSSQLQLSMNDFPKRQDRNNLLKGILKKLFSNFRIHNPESARAPPLTSLFCGSMDEVNQEAEVGASGICRNKKPQQFMLGRASLAGSGGSDLIPDANSCKFENFKWFLKLKQRSNYRFQISSTVNGAGQ